MKYIITINQRAIVDGGLHEKTDLIDWAIIDYIMVWQLSPKANRDGDMVWLNYKHLIKEMPLLGLNYKSAVSKRINKLRNLGLVETNQTEEGRLYIKTTALVFDLTQFSSGFERGVHDGERGVHDGERGVHDGERGVHDGERGVHDGERGVHDGEHSTLNKNIQLKQTIKTPTTTASSVVGSSDLIFSKLFSKAEREKMAKILEGVAEIDVKQQMLDVLAAAAQEGKVKNKLLYLRGLAKSHADGLFDPLPGFYIAQRRADALGGAHAAGVTDQRQVAELESEINSLIRINGQGLLDAQIARKRQKLAELKALKPV